MKSARPALDDVDLELTRAKVRARLLGESAEPTTIGRFEVVGVAGAGAMGRVVVGRDPDLGRKVALKLIRLDQVRDGELDRVRARLMREARALARLSHPNVVPAYEVGSIGDDIYVAMEYIEGRTLRKWMRDEPSTSAVIDVFAQVGRGLAAAHEAGLVHRDVKPDNVLVGDDGRVRVVDFGLALESEEIGPSPEAPTPGAGSSSLTRTGTAAGTPAYLAPEVGRGNEASAASDQYSYCVTLHEALFGVRPPKEPPNVSVPTRLRRLLERGLADAPEDRWPSMTALVDVLEHDPSRRRRVAGALVGASAVAALMGLGVGTLVEEDPCSGLDEELHGVWDDARRTELSAALDPDDEPHAQALAGKLADSLDGYGRLWLEQRVDACEAAQVRREQSAEQAGVRVACLDRARAQLRITVDALTGDTPATRGPKLIEGLQDPEACAQLEAAEGPPKAIAPDVARLRGEHDELRVRYLAADYEAVEPDAQALVERARALGYDPLTAEAQMLLADTQTALGHKEARGTLEAAVWLAEASGDDGLTADLWLRIARVSHSRAVDPEEATPSFERASAAVARVGNDPNRLAALRRSEGDRAADLGKFDVAVDKLTEAATLIEQSGRRGPRLAEVLDSLATAYYDRGQLDDALATKRRAMTIYGDVYGAGHPKTIRQLGHIGVILLARGDTEEAVQTLQDAISSYSQVMGAENRQLIPMINSLGAGFEYQGRPEDAATQYRRSLAIAEAVRGPEHREVVSPLNNLGRILRQTGELDEAQRVLERALAIVEKVSPGHVQIAEPLTSLGTLLLQRGRAQASADAHTRALELRIETHGKDAQPTAISQHNLADALVSLEQYEQALQHIDEADRVFAASLPEGHAYRVSVALVRSRALLGLGRPADGLVDAEAALAHAKDEGTIAAAKLEVARSLRALGRDAERANQLLSEAAATPSASR